MTIFLSTYTPTLNIQNKVIFISVSGSVGDMDLGKLLESPLGVSPRLVWGHARALTSQALSAVSRFPSRGSRDLWLYLEAFPRGFPSRLSHRALPRATVV